VTLSKDVMLELMAYADGELEPAEMARVERLIAADADAKRLVESMGALGRVLVEMHEPSHAAATLGLVDDIMARVEKEGAPRKSMRPPKVVDIRDLREARVKVAAAIVAVVALAAGIVLTTRKANEDSSSQVAKGPATTSPLPRQAPVPATGPDTQVAAAGVDVEQVDTNHDVQVFYLPSSVGANASSVVVWIDDNGAGK
jgi:anti-sigma factor RsiW